MSRPPGHIVGDLAVVELHRIFGAAGWTCNDIIKDYGEDILIRIFNNGHVTPYQFYVQSKSSGNSVHNTIKRGDIFSVQIKRARLEMWLKLENILLITFYDAQSGGIYWTTAEEQKKALIRGKGNTVRLHIPKTQVLNNESLKQIHQLVEDEYKKVEHIREGANLLAEILEDEWDVQIDFDEGGIIFVPEGTFVPHKDKFLKMFIFGGVKSTFLEFCAARGIADDEIQTKGMQELKNILDNAASNPD